MTGLGRTDAATRSPAPRTARLGLWRLELLRLWRTRRWLLLVLGFPVLGAAGPPTAAHLHQILQALGASTSGVPAHPGPDAGIAAYTSVASQLGMLVALGITAGAMAVDHRPGLAAFYRTRTRHGRALVLPRWVVCAGATGCAYLIGGVVTWVETRMLFGPLPTGRMVWGTVFGTLYMMLAPAFVAAAAAVLRRPVALFGTALSALSVLPLPELWSPLRPWSPSRLHTAPAELLRGSQVGDYLGGALVAVLLIAAALYTAVVRVGRREL